MTRRCPGFTLIEMMAAMAISLVVIMVAVSMLNSTGDGYTRVNDGISAEREARAVLFQANDDLNRAVRAGLSIDSSSDDAWGATSLGFLCLQPPDAQAENERIGDLCAVVYYRADLKMGRQNVRCLMRGFRGSQETYTALGQKQWETLYQPREADEPVAFGVVGFHAEGLTRTPEGGLRPWMTGDPENPYASQWPDELRIRLIVARQKLIGKLATPDDWSSHPLLGSAAQAGESGQLEVYESLQPFGHGG